METTEALVAKLRDKLNQPQPESRRYRLPPVSTLLIQRAFDVQKALHCDDVHVVALIACGLAEICEKLEDQVFDLTMRERPPTLVLLPEETLKNVLRRA
jgi:hypothetical protein